MIDDIQHDTQHNVPAPEIGIAQGHIGMPIMVLLILTQICGRLSPCGPNMVAGNMCARCSSSWNFSMGHERNYRLFEGCVKPLSYEQIRYSVQNNLTHIASCGKLSKNRRRHVDTTATS